MHLSAYREDQKKQSSGAPVYTQAGTFFVRRWGTKESDMALKNIRLELFGPLHKHQDTDVLLELAHWLVEYGVSGWDEDVVFDQAGHVKYSQTVARKLFLNPEYFLSLNLELVEFSKLFTGYLYDCAEEDLAAIKKS